MIVGEFAYTAGPVARRSDSEVVADFDFLSLGSPDSGPAGGDP